MKRRFGVDCEHQEYYELLIDIPITLSFSLKICNHNKILF